MKILYLVTEDKNQSINEETKKSIENNLTESDEIVFIDEFSKYEFENAYCKIHQLNFKKDLFDYICIIPNDSILLDKSKLLIHEYVTKDINIKKTILLPLIMLENEDKKGVLNASLYNSENAVYGSLEQEDLNKHLDVTLYGAYIPFHLLLNEEIYDKSLRLYQHYHMIKKLSGLSNIKGIPKIAMVLNYNLSYDNFSREEKNNCFKQIFEIKN